MVVLTVPSGAVTLGLVSVTEQPVAAARTRNDEVERIRMNRYGVLLISVR
jgi:hypothetical protein